MGGREEVRGGVKVKRTEGEEDGGWGKKLMRRMQ